MTVTSVTVTSNLLGYNYRVANCDDHWLTSSILQMKSLVEEVVLHQKKANIGSLNGRTLRANKTDNLPKRRQEK